ncbi:PREDICTED: uncharacterized protein LOC106314828, partial [Brassica oleracea var. oleracea]|uniref:uncharacterized protein LOC106314828 n=1 Tax=Brassica oleracea var. oleracea TaxID=109376 RepID=UPI0006A6DC37
MFGLQRRSKKEKPPQQSFSQTPFKYSLNNFDEFVSVREQPGIWRKTTRDVADPKRRLLQFDVQEFCDNFVEEVVKTLKDVNQTHKKITSTRAPVAESSLFISKKSKGKSETHVEELKDFSDSLPIYDKYDEEPIESLMICEKNCDFPSSESELMIDNEQAIVELTVLQPEHPSSLEKKVQPQKSESIDSSQQLEICRSIVVQTGYLGNASDRGSVQGEYLDLKKIQSNEPILGSFTSPLENWNPEKAPKIELKQLPAGLKYAFLYNNFYPVIVNANLTNGELALLLNKLRKYSKALGYSLKDIPGISPDLCMHRIHLEDDSKSSVEHQRRLNPHLKEVAKKEIIKLLDAGIIYPISDSNWVSPVHVVPKKGGIIVVKNDKNELIPTRTVPGYRICIDYRKLNAATRKDHFPLPFIDQMLERLTNHQYYCFLDGYSGFFQIPIHPDYQEKTTFTCPYGTFAYRRMPFGLSNAPATFQRCMMSIFTDRIEDLMEVFMDDFSVYGSSFKNCLDNLCKVLARCKEKNLVLNWEKCHFMVNDGIVLGHKVSAAGIEVDRAKIEVMTGLPAPTNVKDVRSFLGHAGFYRRFIQDFSKIARPLTSLLCKEVKF